HNVWKDVPETATAEIEAFCDEGGYTYAVGESSRMYYPEMQLTRNARHVINSECGYFILLDELESNLPHTYTWRIHSEKFASEEHEGQFTIVNGNGALNIFTVYPQARNTKIDETVVEEIMTPQRPDDIRRISLKTLKIENSVKSKHCCFLNILQPKNALRGGVGNAGSESGDISVKRLKGETWIGLQVTSRNNTEIFLFSSENKIAYGDIQSRSKWLSIVKDSAGNIIKTTSYAGKVG
ncbi:MAG: hypothetical protein HKN85_06375, partial [Gammaproteobacteria bacterium]|nr:hypothetical protein [Gammaproteobacteria bacterium]